MAASIVAIASAEDLKFFYTVPAQANQCFLQNMLQDHQGTVIVSKFDKNIMLTINDPKGRELDRQLASGKLEKTFDVINGGQHQICLSNSNGQDVTVELQIKTGDLTNERSQQITKNHLRPVESQAFKVNEMVV